MDATGRVSEKSLTLLVGKNKPILPKGPMVRFGVGGAGAIGPGRPHHFPWGLSENPPQPGHEGRMTSVATRRLNARAPSSFV